MAELAVVRRYAHALFQTAASKGMIDQVENDLKLVDQVLREVPRLQRVLRAPTVAGARKRELLRHAFSDRVGELALRFLELLVDRRRETVLNDIYEEYRRLANEHRRILPVLVTAAVPMTDAERDALAAALSRQTGKTVTLQVSIDPSLMGGLVLRMGDTVIDGSVKARLGQLRNWLMTGRSI